MTPDTRTTENRKRMPYPTPEEEARANAMHLRAEAAQGAAPLDYSLPPEVANAEVEWGADPTDPEARQPCPDPSAHEREADMTTAYMVGLEKGRSEGAAPLDVERLARAIALHREQSSAKGQGCDHNCAPGIGEMYARQSEGAAPRAEGLDDVDVLRECHRLLTVAGFRSAAARLARLSERRDTGPFYGDPQDDPHQADGEPNP